MPDIPNELLWFIIGFVLGVSWRLLTVKLWRRW